MPGRGDGGMTDTTRCHTCDIRLLLMRYLDRTGTNNACHHCYSGKSYSENYQISALNRVPGGRTAYSIFIVHSRGGTVIWYLLFKSNEFVRRITFECHSGKGLQLSRRFKPWTLYTVKTAMVLCELNRHITHFLRVLLQVHELMQRVLPKMRAQCRLIQHILAALLMVHTSKRVFLPRIRQHTLCVYNQCAKVESTHFKLKYTPDV